MEYRGLTLDAFQEQAIQHLADDKSVLVAAPTGTGKTLVADWIVDQALQKQRRVIYTAPIKALSNQKFRDYCKLHGEQNVGLVTGDLVIRRDAPCLVMTTEILRNMLLSGDPLHDLEAVVVDEVHFLDDRDRGTVWEEMLIYLPHHVLIVALSATLPNLDDFSAWLSSVRGRPVEVVIEETRAVPLSYHFCAKEQPLMRLSEFAKKAKKAGGGKPVKDKRGRGRDRRGRGRNQQGRTHPIDVFKAIRYNDGLPMLYFVFSRHDAERYAKTLAFRYRAELLDGYEVGLVDDALEAADIGKALTDELRDMYRRGIAFHHAGTHVQLKAIVEELYERKLIKCLFCTSTFALGINMPARSVAFHGLMKFDGQAVRPLTTRGFMQKAGRAGRRGLDEAGHVVLRMDLDEYAEFAGVLDRYKDQHYEPVRSSFNLSWNSIINLLERQDLDHIRTVVGKSFLSWHLRKRAEEALERADALEAGTPDRAPSKRDLKEARRLRRRAEKGEDQCWQEFLAKRDFLQSVGYIDEDDAFQAGARVLKHLQISEIILTELVLSGVLEDLDDHRLFALLFALTSRVPRAVHIVAKLDRKDRELADAVMAIRHGEVVTRAESITRQEIEFSPELMPLGAKWAKGVPLVQILLDISSPTDWSGTLVGGLRRAKDLLSQLRDVYAEVPDRAEALKRLHKAVSRDEVEVVD